MSIRKLPEIKALDAISGLEFPADDAALARWNPGVHAVLDADNSISIYNVIGDDPLDGGGVSSKRIAAALRKIGGQDVVVNVNSPGGDFFEGVAIYNLLREHPHNVTVRVIGLAASAASLVAMAGDKIEISDIGFLMIHNAWALAMGNRHDMRAAADTLEPFDDAMASVYAKRSKAKKDEVAAWMDAEKWFNGEQAVEAGLADALLPSAEVDDGTNAKMTSITALRRVESALARQGVSKKEAKTLIAAMKFGERDAADPIARDAGSSAMRDAGEIAAEATRLISKFGLRG